jgi:ribosomal protein S19E (S16A)
MATKRLGIYQRTVLQGIDRDGKQPSSISNGYSKQVKSLKSAGYVQQKGNFLYLTPTGQSRVKKLKK